jgi:hypothetical protein
VQYIKHKDKILKRNRKYWNKHLPAMRELQNDYYLKNKARLNAERAARRKVAKAKAN